MQTYRLLGSDNHNIIDNGFGYDLKLHFNNNFLYVYTKKKPI